MRTVREFRAWAAGKYRTGHRSWLALDDLGSGVVAEFGLAPPSEQAVGRDAAGAVAWVAEWRSATLPAGVSVVWVRRRWRSFGEQELPSRVRVEGARTLATLAGAGPAWRELERAASALSERWPALAPALPGAAGGLGRLAADDLARLLATVEWFGQNPASELLARQVPVEGVDTKWLGRHRGLVTRLVSALTGAPDLGLRVEPRRFRVRLLDGGGAGGAPADFSAPASELARLTWTPASVLICENLANVAALPPDLGLVAVHGNGLAAPELAQVPWLRASRVLYWGDLDTHGFAILSLVRQVLPQVESVLMDAATLARFEALAGREPSPFRGPIGHLTASERAALAALRVADRRLEQERIPLSYALAALVASGAPGVRPDVANLDELASAVGGQQAGLGDDAAVPAPAAL